MSDTPPDYSRCAARPVGRLCDLDIVRERLADMERLASALTVALARGAIVRGIEVFLIRPLPMATWIEPDPGGGIIALPCTAEDQDLLEDYGARWGGRDLAQQARMEPIENILRRLRGVA